MSWLRLTVLNFGLPTTGLLRFQNKSHFFVDFSKKDVSFAALRPVKLASSVKHIRRKRGMAMAKKSTSKTKFSKLAISEEWDKLTKDHLSFDFQGHAAVLDPAPNCQQWLTQYFRPRVWMAIAVWSNVDLKKLTAATPLGGISPAPWGAGQQFALVQLTNQGGVLAPFGSKMAAPPVVAPPATSILQWERAVWYLQAPKCPCYGPYPF